MVLWGFRWLKLFLNPFARDDFSHITEDDRRDYILTRLEGAEFSEWSWVVVVAGVGFFTDAYSIFAINMVVPMLGIIYHGGTMPHVQETLLSVLTLGGSIIGQLIFGFGADVWGRRKMYGVELIITIGATLGVVMASDGTAGSMSIIVWLLIWRFVLGIGIGADYPLSAVICSEFAPTHLRGRMMTAVFMCQPIGQLAATLVTLIASANLRHGIPADATAQSCDPTCQKTLDQIWRWIIGVGVIPAVIALWFRLTIIESPRYTADVQRDSKRAVMELNRYLLQAEAAAASGLSVDRHSLNPETYPLRRMSSGADSGVASDPGSAPEEDISPVPFDVDRASIPPDGHPVDKEQFITADRIQSGIASEDGQFRVSRSLPQYHSTFTDLGPPAQDPDGLPAEDPVESQVPPAPSWEEFKQYFWHQGNLRTLIATSFCWFCVDLPFYGLGMNTPRIITAVWYGRNVPDLNVYPLLIHNVWQSLIVVSLGAIVGCAITMVAIDKLGRRTIQIIGFFWLFILFIVIGGSFTRLYDIGDSSAIVVLYILCQIFFNFGPNTTTYIMSAELFPTRYRGLCHGISAASGKLGSVIAQLFLAYINYGHDINYNTIGKWLPYSLLIFSIPTLLGLITTVAWIPGQEHAPDGKIKTLEQWEVGRPTPNNFAHTWFARVIEAVWKKLVKIADRLYMVLDWIAGGEEKERRESAKKAATVEMEEREAQEALYAQAQNGHVGEGGVLGEGIMRSPAPSPRTGFRC